VRFCSACGARLASPPPTVCEVCGRGVWRNAKPGAAALVVRDERLLLVRRAHDPWRGAWCAPSGFCDGDEHPIRTAEREALEEAGIGARITGFLGIWAGPYGQAGPDAETVAVAYYHALPVDGQRGTPDPAEVAEVKWFAWEELPTDLAPPERFPAVLEAWHEALLAGETVTPLRDRP
jgi:ADP-ribose pyrophosphatase YjhB (NUDIX family)